MVVFKSIEEFLLSDSFLGDRDTTKTRVYDQWLYIAAYFAYTKEELKGPAKFKFGYTTNIKDRSKAHEAGAEETSFKATILYSWPIPNAKQFETEIKRYFKNFIYKDAFDYLGLGNRIVDTRTEIIWGIKLFTLVKLFRLIILKCALQFGYINAPDLVPLFDSFMPAPDCIVDDDERYANYLGCSRKVSVKSLVMEAQYKVKYKLLNTPNGDHRKGYTQMSETGFYKYVLQGWKYIEADHLLKNLPYSYNEVDRIGLSIGDRVNINWQSQIHSCEIVAYGQGPLLGAYIVRWIKSENPLQYYSEDYIVGPSEIVKYDLRL